MSGKRFLDTNIFVYAVDRAAPRQKHEVAQNLIREGIRNHDTVVSYQVVQEFLNTAIRRFSSAITVADAQDYITAVFQPLLAVHSSIELFHDALDIRGRYKLSWYDSLIVAAASISDCGVLYSEDLSHGMKIRGVRIENPFRSN